MAEGAGMLGRTTATSSIGRIKLLDEFELRQREFWRGYGGEGCIQGKRFMCASQGARMVLARSGAKGVGNIVFRYRVTDHFLKRLWNPVSNFRISCKLTSDVSTKTALKYATENGHAKIICLLVEGGANVNATGLGGCIALHISAQNKNAETVRILCEDLDANVNPPDIFFLCHVQKAEQRRTPLHLAVENEAGETVRMLCTEGGHLNAADNCGETALHLAAHDGHTNIPHCSHDGQTPLHAPAPDGNLHIARLLVERGADVNTTGMILGIGKWSPFWKLLSFRIPGSALGQTRA
ncbi:ankyrin repeat-containing domain protein [Mycena vulgaris]|nr:ankyrin repeat-containing domain protein [Mycena vulgaris]